MKLPLLFAILAVAGASAALATPREIADLIADHLAAPINSYGRMNDAGNTTVTHTFAGGYTAKFLTITGTIGSPAAGTWQAEASILCTPPAGAAFIIQPYNANAAWTGALNTPAGSYTIPLTSTQAAAGTWSFQFFDRWDDLAAAADCVWTACSVQLDDGTAPAAVAIGALGQTYANVAINGTAALPGFDQTFVAPTGTGVAGIRIRIQATGTTAQTATNVTTNSPAGDIRVVVTPPTGIPLVAAAPFAVASASTSVGELLQNLPATIDSAGSWRVQAYTANSAANTTAFAQTLAIELIALTPPVNTDLGTLVVNVQKDGAATLAAGQTKWFKFNMPVALDALTNRALEIDTEGSPVGDTSVGLYSAGGARVNADFVDGTDSLANLSFGVDNHPAPGNGVAFNGRDGAALAAGDYYLAVTAGDVGVAYQPGLFGVTNTSTLTGAVQAHIRWLEPGAATPTATDVGAIVGGPGGTELVTTSGVNIDTAGQVKWLKFHTSNDALAAGTGYVDIDTEGTVTIDTEIGVYRNDGTRVADDDDDATGLLSQLTFGDTAAPRPAMGDQIYNGRDGDLVAGTYYLAVGVFDVTYNNAFWNATSTGATLGPITVNFRSNLPNACSSADIGVQGGVAGQDRLLDNNDFIVYIANFFAQAASADIGIQGGVPGSDNAWDNNDFIVYIAIFFTDQPNCTGNP